MLSFALLSLLAASAFAGDVLVEPIPQYTQEQNTATGEYGYSYHGGPSAKTEYRAADGTTTGTYSYVDAHGILQTTSYIADEFGFRAAGSNIPVDGVTPLDAPDVALAKAAHLAEHGRQTLAALQSHRKKRGAILPTLAVAPAITVAHHVPIATSSQSRFQIHNGAKIITSHIAAAPIIASPVLASHSLLYRKKRGIAAVAPIAAAVPLPPSSAKIYDELPKPAVLAAPVAAPIAAPLAAPIAAPIAAPLAARFAAPIAAPLATITQHVPFATSSQSRFQIHNGARIIEQVIAPAAPAFLPAAPIAPAYPAYPAAPIAPAYPAGPIAPAYPAGPIAPGYPGAPIAPGYPGAPIEEAVYADTDSIAVDSA